MVNANPLSVYYLIDIALTLTLSLTRLIYQANGMACQPLLLSYDLEVMKHIVTSINRVLGSFSQARVLAKFGGSLQSICIVSYTVRWTGHCFDCLLI